MKRARASVSDPVLGMSELRAHDSAEPREGNLGPVPLSHSVFVAALVRPLRYWVRLQHLGQGV